MNLVPPPGLVRGGCIGIIAPSSAIRDERLWPGVAAIEKRGYKVVLGDHVFDKFAFTAGTPKFRAMDFQHMFENPDISGIICARGGYTAWQLTEFIDWEVVACNPKPFVGFSDVTSLHLAIHEFAGFGTFHGPMVTTLGGGLTDHAESSLWDLLENSVPFGMYDRSFPSQSTLVPGVAVGPIAGGCISVLAANVGTEWQADFSHCIVCLEDVGEPIVHAHRHLHQLVRACRLDQAAGFVIGEITDYRKSDRDDADYSMTHLWRELIAPLGKPTIVGFPFGHVNNPMTMPLGCRARLDADNLTLEILEPAVTLRDHS